MTPTIEAFSNAVLALILAAIFAIAMAAIPSPVLADQVRIKDIASIEGARPNQLLGYGLVIGLNGTGDSLRNAPFADSSMRSMLDQLGIGLNQAEMRTKNVAAVLVTADLPAYANKGARIDLNLSSIGDASSLRGGTLVFTPLYGGDGKIYASAQGRLVVSAFAAEGDGAQVVNNSPTAGRIPNGGIVEKSAPGNFEDENVLILALNNPDFETSILITDQVNKYTREKFGKSVAREVDGRTIKIKVPSTTSPARFFAAIGKLTVEPDTPARIIVDERTGTVIIGDKVKISRVAITHGGLTVAVSEKPNVSQPMPFSQGETALTPDTDINVFEGDANLNIVEGPDLSQLVNGLNMMGADATAIIAILQGLKSAGALQGELVVQ